MLIVQAVFLKSGTHTDKQTQKLTDATDRPTHGKTIADSKGKYMQNYSSIPKINTQRDGATVR